jgi:hypothetical protein
MYLKLKKSIEETMKKQIFLLSVGLLMASSLVVADCNTCPVVPDCNPCMPMEHGHTFVQVTPHFQAASPELVSMFNSNVLHNLDKEDKHGAFEVVVFGGKNTKQSQFAGNYLPYGKTTLTFDGSVTAGTNLQNFSQVTAETVAVAYNTPAIVAGDQAVFSAGYSIGGPGVVTSAPSTKNPVGIYVDQATFGFDSNRDKSKILPWNFGITFAALFEPRRPADVGESIGTGLVTSPAFKSVISPTLTYSHVGAGLALRYHFSDDKNGWWGLISTAVQNVKSKFCLNENVQTESQTIDITTFPVATTAANIYGAPAIAAQLTTYPFNEGINQYVLDPNSVSTVAAYNSVYTAYNNTKFPNPGNTDTVVPANVAEAFAQTAWSYGKVAACAQKITRLADIELSLGYQWMCGDCASTNWYLGVVIPTGNKGGAVYVAPAVVGNGQHAGIMTGSCTEVQLSDEADYSAWFRLDINARYLFRNTQKRSFDLLGNEWSRYMMVWENEAAYTAAVAAANTLTFTGTGVTLLGTGVPNRNYTPGINVFTTDFYIKPQFQARINQAVYFQGEHLRAELGWNTFMRQKDCVELTCDWTAAPAFADSSYVAGVGLNNNRTIYNDSQTTTWNAVDSLNRAYPVTFPGTSASAGTLYTVANNALSDSNYEAFAIGADQIDYNSVATPNAIVNTPYLSLGYAFESDYKPQLSVGGSYEFTTRNSALNQWLVWGKFEIAF